MDFDKDIKMGFVLASLSLKFSVLVGVYQAENQTLMDLFADQHAQKPRQAALENNKELSRDFGI